MAVISVDLAGRPYEVRVAAGLLADLPQQCSPRLRKRRVPVVTDANVYAAWGQTVEHALHEGGHEAAWRILPPGEPSKSWEQLAATTDWLLAEEVERGDCILALGGGVIGDLTGFAAAVLKRGCQFIRWRQDCDQHASGQEPGRRVSPARAGAGRSGGARHFARARA
jgi:3-dehydroquinate synthase